MDCPNCGARTLDDQKFCRACGSSLQLITKPLPAPTKLAKVDRERAPTISGKVTSLGFIIMFIGVAIGVIGKMLMHEEIVTVAGILLSLAGMFLLVYPFLSAVPSQKNSRPPSEGEALTASSATPSLNQARMDFMPSITERTTDLLASELPPSREKEDRESHS